MEHVGCCPRRAGAAGHQVCPRACSNTDLQHIKPPAYGRLASCPQEMLRRAASPKRWRCITSGRLGCRHRSAGGAQHHVCPCACSNADFQHTQPKRMARWALALGVSVQAQNNNCSTSSKQSRRCLFNKHNFFLNVLLCFIRIGQFALFSLKEKIQQIDLFEEKKICQVYKI